MMSVTPSSFKIPHVFLSFRGEDTRKNFTDHLCFALKREGILIFPDNEVLSRRENISTVLLSAIRGSRISIVVFSKGYASSSWCLDELVEIVHRRNTPGPGHTLLPIFYHVDPSDVRNQTGTFAEAFARHEEWFQTEMERVQRWRAALTEAANSSGWVLKDVANGSKEIHKIVEEVSDVVRDCLNGPRYSMRMDSCVKKIIDLLNLGTSDIRIVGMSWMDGIVKKTLTEVVYNQICDGFEVSSFILDIRAISRVPNGLVHLQEQLLCDILKMKNFNINNVDEGINLIEETIQGKRVLFVLDDVDHFKQLHALVGNSKCFGPGSRVIATSRDEQLRTELEAHGKYKVEDLRYWKSLQLFSWHASMMANPAEDFSHKKRIDHYLPLKNKGHDYKVKFNPNATVPIRANLDLSEIDQMDQHLKYSTSGHSEGQFKIPSVDIPAKVGTSVWGIPRGIIAHHTTSDVSLFSSSLPVLPHEKLNFTDSELGGQSVDDNLSKLNKLGQEIGYKDPLEDVEANGIGNMLPDDEDVLLAGIMDDFDLSGLPSQLEDLENDLFGSGGGMELEFEPQEHLSIGLSKLSISDGVASNSTCHFTLSNGVATAAGEHPYGEHPSRTLFVRNINSNVKDSELISLFEQYGDIRTLYTACKHRGFVMISYYDIRAARTAMRSLQNKPLRRRKLDIHFSIPKDNPSEKDINQGTLVVFNLDPSISNDDLCQIFGAYGEVKEIRETPHKRHHKFIEFYDVRAAEAALRALNRSDIAGRRIKLEPSRPGGARRNLMQQPSQELEQDEIRSFRHHVGSPVTTSPPGEGSEKQITSEPEEVVFDVEAVQITSNFSEEMKFEIEEFEIEPEAVDIDQHVSDTIIQPKEVLMQGGLGLIEPPKDEDWKNVKEIYLMHNELSGFSGNPRHPMPLAPFLHKRHKLTTSFDALQILDLSKTGIRSLPESIVRLVNLKRLILSYCHRFMRLSPKVGELKQLEVLDLEGTEITDLPENLRCPKLLELFLHKNHKLRTIPPSFFDYMPALQVLNLSRTGIRSLPESIVRLISLKSLFLSYCHHLKRLSPKVGELNQLEVLDLEGTEIKDLPENLRFFMLLAPFFQNDNKLRTIPLSSFDALQILNLSRTDIRSLPESIVRLINLKRLILSYCHRLRRLSPKVGELKQLEVLDLEGTEIMDFPEEIKKLTNLTCLKFSFYGYVGDGSGAMQSDAVVPCGVISNLSHLKELMISVNPNDKQWNACVEDIVKEVCTLESLNTLLFYFPKVELVKHFLLNSPVWVYQSLSHFRFIVGDHVKRIMSRLPRDVEPELERWERCLKYINGVAIPSEIKEVLQYSTAFFLERHAIVKKLSDFGIENMKQLKCCVVGECNDVEVIIDETVDHEEDSEADAHEEDDEANAREEEADAHEEDDEVEAYREDGSSEIVSKTSGAEKIVLGSLEYLCIYYMKNLRTIWKGPVQPKCLSLLKSLTLRTCPQLTTIFTRGLLENLYNLEELTIEDCPSIKTLVSFEVSAEHKTSHFLPNLKWISLHYMPKLDTISSGLHIAPRSEWLSFYNCPNLKNPLIEEVSSKDLKKIKGERSWWEALEWRSGRPAYLDDIFVPINIWDC